MSNKNNRESENPIVSVVLATRNRRDDLLKAIGSVLAQKYEPVEVLVYDDASTDGTGVAVKERFSEVRYSRMETCGGQAGLRDKGFKEARGEYVLSLDDDAFLTGAETLSHIVEQFDNDETIAAVAMPFFEFERNVPESMLKVGLNLSMGQELKSFTGCAVAFRKSCVLASGGYRDYLVGQVEEKDLSVRLWNKGFRVVYGGSAPVVHMVSAIRNSERVHYLGVRNTLLFNCLNVPHPYVLPRMAVDCAQLFVYRLKWRNAFRRLWYVLSGLCSCLKYIGDRNPVSRSVYRRFKALPNHAPEKRDGEIPDPLTGRKQ